MTYVGDSGALRSAINAQHQQGTGPNDYPDQAHHLLSSNVLIKLEKEFGSLAENSEYDLNGASNGLLMPANYGHQKHPNLQRHRGGHSAEFYAKVRKRVVSIYELYEGADPCNDEKAKKNILGALTSAENDVKGWLKSADWELYSNSKVLFDRDYRDEGVGDLSIDRAPFTDKASALKWLEDKAVGLKRRYEGVTGKEEVKKQFYTNEGYPVPGDPRA